MDIRKLYRTKFQKLDIEPADELWSRLSEKLDKNSSQETPTKANIINLSTNTHRKIPLGVKGWISIAAVLILGAFISLKIISPTSVKNTTTLAKEDKLQEPSSVNNLEQLQEEGSVIKLTTRKKTKQNIQITNITDTIPVLENEVGNESLFLASENKPSKKWFKKKIQSPSISGHEISESIAELMKMYKESDRSVLSAFKNSYPTQIPSYLDRLIAEKYSSTGTLASTNKGVVLSALQIPDIITPNNDGANDIWEIRGLENFNSHLLMVTTTMGDIVYKSEDYKNDWNGEDIAMGTYFYVLKVNYDNGGELIKKGVISILR